MKRLEKRMLAIAIFVQVLSITPAHASDWQVVASAEKMTVLIDKNSMARAGKYKKAWFQYSYDVDQAGNSSTSFKIYRSTKTLEYFDCEEHTSAQVQVAYYSAIFGAGDFLGSIAVKPQAASFTEVIPDTVGEVLLEFVCKGTATRMDTSNKKQGA
jgi:hypothetical protein